jgi:opacity protein-like surface antigen
MKTTREGFAFKGSILRMLGILCVLLLALSANAQKNDLALTLGGYLQTTSPLDLGAAWALEGSYARSFWRGPALSTSVELPVAGSFDSSIPTLSGLTVASSYNSLFITPGLRVRLGPSFFISPYVAAGIGYGRFNKSLINGRSVTDNTMALDIGGGLDLKILPYISLRGEIRDFNSGGLNLPSLAQELATGRQNNLFITAGVAVKF